MPGTTSFVEVQGKKIQLTVGGDGPPLLYLHSAGGEADWLPFHERLAKHFKVYVPAHPGFALSTGLEGIRDINDLAWHYVDFCEQLGLSHLPVVGFSLGGWLACEIAILRPQLIDQMVLVAAAGLRVEGAPMAELFVDDFDKLRQLLFFDPNGPAVSAAMPLTIDDPRILLWLRAREATARVGWNPYLHNPRLRAHLRRVQQPALAIWGRHDKLIPAAHGEEYAKLLPHCRFEAIEQCGHMVPFEKTDELAARTLSFLQAR